MPSLCSTLTGAQTLLITTASSLVVIALVLAALAR
jgi:hypothetical protein